MSKNLSRRLFEKLRTKSDVTIDEGQLRTIAGQFKKDDLQDEAKLRQLIQQLSAFSGKTITEEKETQILQKFREQQLNPNDLQSLSKLFKK